MPAKDARIGQYPAGLSVVVEGEYWEGASDLYWLLGPYWTGINTISSCERLELIQRYCSSSCLGPLAEKSKSIYVETHVEHGYGKMACFTPARFEKLKGPGKLGWTT